MEVVSLIDVASLVKVVSLIEVTSLIKVVSLAVFISLMKSVSCPGRLRTVLTRVLEFELRKEPQCSNSIYSCQSYLISLLTLMTLVESKYPDIVQKVSK